MLFLGNPIFAFVWFISLTLKATCFEFWDEHDTPDLEYRDQSPASSIRGDRLNSDHFFVGALNNQPDLMDFPSNALLLRREFGDHKLAKRAKDTLPPDLHHLQSWAGNLRTNRNPEDEQRLLSEIEGTIETWRTFPRTHHRELEEGGVTDRDLEAWRREYDDKRNALFVQRAMLQHRNRIQESQRIAEVLNNFEHAWTRFHRAMLDSNKKRKQMKEQLIRKGVTTDLRAGGKDGSGGASSSRNRDKSGGGSTSSTSGTPNTGGESRDGRMSRLGRWVGRVSKSSRG